MKFFRDLFGGISWEEWFLMVLLLSILLGIVVYFINYLDLGAKYERYALVNQSVVFYGGLNKSVLYVEVCRDFSCGGVNLCPHVRRECFCDSEDLATLVFEGEDKVLNINKGMLIDVRWVYIPNVGWRIRGVDYADIN